MENVVLTIHLILALLLVGVVLLQRSEGGGLGIGGGNSVMTGRGTATALSKVTWGLAVCFIITSVTLTWMAAVRADGESVIDSVTAPVDATGTTPPAPAGNLLPDLPSSTAPAAPATGNAEPAAPAAPSPSAPAATEPAPAAPAPAAPATNN
jgi:preprotein translocase subunit SecG